MSPQPSKEELDTHQMTANYDFVPFVVKLLSGEKYPPRELTLPLDKPEFLTLEAVEAIQEIANKATFSFLCENTGWQRAPYILPSEENPQHGRLWQAPVWRQLKLEFTHLSLDLLLSIFNISRRPPHPAEAKEGKHELPNKKELRHLLKQQNKHVKASQEWLQTAKPGTNGDILLHHLTFRHLDQARLFSKINPNTFAHNPLNLLTHPHLFNALKANQLQLFERLLKDDLRPFLPWLSLDWSKRWCAIEPERWNGGLEGFDLFNQHLALVLKGWLALIVGHEEERCDLLVPLLHYYKKLLELFDPPRDWTEPFQLMVRTLRIVDRQNHARNWAETFTPALFVRRVYDIARTTHPIDREAPQRLFMEVYQHLEFDAVLKPIEELLAILQPKVG